MNSQESEVLQSFLDQLIHVHGVDKVPQADAMIKRAVAQQPDAAYLLVQRTLLLGQALDQAKARIAELERAQEESSRGFLDSAAPGWSAGPRQSSTPGSTPPRPPAGTTAPSFQTSGPQFSGTPYAAPAAPSVPPNAGAAPSFLGQVAATAAGVAGGAFLFEGIESMLGHQGSSIPGGGAAPTFPTEDVTINNYYADDERPGGIAAPSFEDDADPGADTDDSDSESDSADDGGDFV
jgi:hypothetical protein